jgi:predicted MFS family arabinose efflux permease
MIVVLARWRPAETARVREPIGSAIMTGVLFCAQSRPIARVLVRGALFGFGSIAFQALLPAIVRNALHGDQIAFGMEVGTFGLGSVVSALLVSRVRRKLGSETVVGAGTVICAAGQMLLSSTHTLPLAMIAGLIAGFGWVAVLTSLNVAIQLRSPEEILGRCLSIYQSVAYGGMAVGAWAWGALADRIGLVESCRIAALWLMLTLIMRLVAPMPAREEGRITPVESPT